jgi:hypothetical protein
MKARYEHVCKELRRVLVLAPANLTDAAEVYYQRIYRMLQYSDCAEQGLIADHVGPGTWEASKNQEFDSLKQYVVFKTALTRAGITVLENALCDLLSARTEKRSAQDVAMQGAIHTCSTAQRAAIYRGDKAFCEQVTVATFNDASFLHGISNSYKLEVEHARVRLAASWKQAAPDDLFLACLADTRCGTLALSLCPYDLTME